MSHVIELDLSLMWFLNQTTLNIYIHLTFGIIIEIEILLGEKKIRLQINPDK